MINTALNISGVREFQDHIQRIRSRGGRVGDAILVWGQAVARKARNTARGKGGRSFWRDQARQVRVAKAGIEGAQIHINRIGAHWQEGGDIFPDKARALTVPIADEARGKRAAEFETGGRDLFVIEPKSGNADTQGILGYSEDDIFHPLYALRSRVHHEPDPWFPELPEVLAIGQHELRRFARQLAEGK